jgi:hypothetical protein
VDEKVFIYLRLVLGTETLATSKIRELAGLGSLLAQFLHRTLQQGVELPPEAGEDQVPALDYVDANTEEVLIRFRADPEAQVQVIEGRIPPPYQARMLDPATSQISLQSFSRKVAEDVSDQKRRELSERLARAQINVLEQIRENMDDEGRFEVRVPA